MALTEKLKYGSYEILQNPEGVPCILGKGSFGVTYKARHVYLGRINALKVIREDLLNRGSKEDHEETNRFLDEARAVGRLHHPGIAMVHDCALDNGVFYYAMEYCDGGTLQNLCDKQGPLPWPELRLIAIQIASALDYAHACGFLHRDIKPANIMLNGEGKSRQAKLIDFGLAKKFTSGSESSSATVRNDQENFRGNFATASPEQILEKPLDQRSDLFSLGVTLWWLLIGKNPFGDLKRGQLIADRVGPSSYAPLLPMDLDGEARDLLEALLEKDSEKRIASAHQVVERLGVGNVVAMPYSPHLSPALTREPLPAPADLEPDYLPKGILTKGKLVNLYKCINQANGQLALFVAPDDLLEPEAIGRMRIAASRKLNLGAYAFLDWRMSGGQDAFVISKPEGASLLSVLRKFGPARFADALPFLIHLARRFDSSEAWTTFGIQMDPDDIMVRTRDGSAELTQFRTWSDLDPLTSQCLPFFTSVTDHAGSSEATISTSAREFHSLAQFAALVYRVLAGKAIPYAAFFTTNGYVMASGLSEDGNALLADTICAPESQPCAYRFLQLLASLESLPIAEHPPLVDPPTAEEIEIGKLTPVPTRISVPDVVARGPIIADSKSLRLDNSISVNEKVAELERQLAQAKRDAEEEARLAEEKAREEAEAKQRAAEEKLLKEEEEAKLRAAEEMERKAAEARRQAEELARQAAEARRKADADAEEAKRKAAREAEARKEAEAKRHAEELAAEARRVAEETEAKRKAAAEAEVRKEAEAKRHAMEQAEEAKRVAAADAEEEAKRKAAMEAVAHKEAEAKRHAEEKARQAAMEDARRKAEETRRAAEAKALSESKIKEHGEAQARKIADAKKRAGHKAAEARELAALPAAEAEPKVANPSAQPQTQTQPPVEPPAPARSKSRNPDPSGTVSYRIPIAATVGIILLALAITVTALIMKGRPEKVARVPAPKPPRGTETEAKPDKSAEEEAKRRAAAIIEDEKRIAAAKAEEAAAKEKQIADAKKMAEEAAKAKRAALLKPFTVEIASDQGYSALQGGYSYNGFKIRELEGEGREFDQASAKSGIDAMPGSRWKVTLLGELDNAEKELASATLVFPKVDKSQPIAIKLPTVLPTVEIVNEYDRSDYTHIRLTPPKFTQGSGEITLSYSEPKHVIHASDLIPEAALADRKLVFPVQNAKVSLPVAGSGEWTVTYTGSRLEDRSATISIPKGPTVPKYPLNTPSPFSGRYSIIAPMTRFPDGDDNKELKLSSDSPTPGKDSSPPEVNYFHEMSYGENDEGPRDFRKTMKKVMPDAELPHRWGIVTEIDLRINAVPGRMCLLYFYPHATFAQYRGASTASPGDAVGRLRLDFRTNEYHEAVFDDKSIKPWFDKKYLEAFQSLGKVKQKQEKARWVQAIGDRIDEAFRAWTVYEVALQKHEKPPSIDPTMPDFELWKTTPKDCVFLLDLKIDGDKLLVTKLAEQIEKENLLGGHATLKNSPPQVHAVYFRSAPDSQPRELVPLK